MKEVIQLKQGTLVYDSQRDRMDVRFGLDDYLGGLHCGDTLEVLVGSRWKPTRIEMRDDWYLVGITATDLVGLRVRV